MTAKMVEAICACGCGERFRMRSVDQRRGRRYASKSCANKRRVVSAYSGDTIGAWTLVEFVRMDSSGQQWMARCVCGLEAVKSLAKLRQAQAIGCRKCSRRRMWDEYFASKAER